MPMENSFLMLKQLTNPENAEWRLQAEKEINETQENYNVEMQTLKGLVLSDPNLKAPHSDEFLLRFLRARKFNGKRAFQMLQRYYLMKLKCPELFSCPLPSECSKTFDLQAQTMLSHRDQWGRRVYVIRVDNFDSSKVSIDDIFRINILALEQIVREPETQIAGIVVILDMSGLSLQHAKFFTPYYGKRMVELVQETFPLRFKGFHVVNEPFFFDAVMAVLKPFLKDKIKKRIRNTENMCPRLMGDYLKDNKAKSSYESSDALFDVHQGRAYKKTIKYFVNKNMYATDFSTFSYYNQMIFLHGSDLNALQAFISSDILPTEYGGNAGSFDNKSWCMRLLADEEYFKTLKDYGYVTNNVENVEVES